MDSLVELLSIQLYWKDRATVNGRDILCADVES